MKNTSRTKTILSHLKKGIPIATLLVVASCSDEICDGLLGVPPDLVEEQDVNQAGNVPPAPELLTGVPAPEPTLTGAPSGVMYDPASNKKKSQ